MPLYRISRNVRKASDDGAEDVALIFADSPAQAVEKLTAHYLDTFDRAATWHLLEPKIEEVPQTGLILLSNWG